MSAPTALLEVLEELKEEAKRTPEIIVPFSSWNEYRKRQQMWNPSWSEAAEMDIYRSYP